MRPYTYKGRGLLNAVDMSAAWPESKRLNSAKKKKKSLKKLLMLE